MEEYSKRSKCTHFNNPGDPHGLTFTCYKKRKFLNYNRTRMYFIDAVNRARIRFNFDVWAYVIMPDHVHLLIYPKNEVYSIPDILKAIKQPVAWKTTNFLRSEMPEIAEFLKTGEKHHPYRFWQDGFGYDRNIRNDIELSNFIDYAHENPVRRGLVEKSVEWYWSSARDWFLDVDGTLHIDKESFPMMDSNYGGRRRSVH